MSAMREKMIKEMTLRRLSANTQRSYLNAVSGLARYYNQSPEKMNKKMIQDYLFHLLQERKLQWSTCNVIVHGLRFFYTKTLSMDAGSLSLPPYKRENKLPEVLSRCLITSVDIPTELLYQIKGLYILKMATLPLPIETGEITTL
jgi:site-specific recombinase XerD